VSEGEDNMHFGRMWAEAFLSIEDVVQFDFQNKGLVLIQGDNLDDDAFESNGAGKSTTFSETISYVLFGETIRGYKGDKVVNRTVGKNTRVALEVFDDNGDKYLIERHRKHKEHKNHVRVFRNGENITPKSDKDTDQYIIDLLQLDFTSFTNSVMFGQGMTKMFASATDSEQKKIMERMLQIDIFVDCMEEAKKRLKEVKTDMELAEDSVNTKTNILASQRVTINQLQEKEAMLGEQIDSTVKECNEKIAEYESELEDMDTPTDLLESIANLEELARRVQVKIDSYDELQSSRNDLASDMGVLQREMKKLEKDYTADGRKLADIQAGKNVPKTCSECGQDLPLDDTTHIENHLKDNIKKAMSERKEKSAEHEELKVLVEKIDKKLEGRKKQVDNLQDVKDAMAEKRSEIKLLENKDKNLRANIASKKKEIERALSLKDKSYTDLITQAVEEARKTEQEIADINKELENLKVEYQEYEFWVNSFSNKGIKSALLKTVTPFLNTRANKYLARLAPSIEVKFSTEKTLASGEKREQFSVEIVNSHGGDEYKGNSGGERRRIDLAVIMALQDLVASRSNKSIDFILYDEAFEGMDNLGCQLLIELLKEKAKDMGTVLVITHNDNLKQLFTKTIKVAKENGATIIVEVAA
jgi:DNA repair exonuclease SbcCD ATPase subunit